MLIDLHCHTKQRSGCSRADEEDMIRHAIRRGLDGLAITDHNKLVPSERLRELNDKYRPFIIFSGIEITLTTARESLDFLVIGLHDPRLETGLPSGLPSEGKRNIPHVAGKRWTYKALRAFVRDRNGFLVLAHPFRFCKTLPDTVIRHPPDAVEIRSLNIPSCDAPRIEALAQAWQCPVIGSSDAHHSEDVGCHAIRLKSPVHTDKELTDQLRERTFVLRGVGNPL